MRVAIITESFPPDVNGVAHCVLRVAELLAARGHQPLVVAPRPPRTTQTRELGPFPYPVVRVPAVPLPGYPSFRLGLPSRRVRDALITHQTEVVHLASPVVLGAHGAAVARRLGLPVVAVFQTDLPSYARAYRLGRAGEALAWRWLRGIHNTATRTLAPSTVTATGLLGRGIVNVWLWGRGVDTVRFDPARRSEKIRARLAPGGELIAGYVGRLATEKRVELLAKITALPGVRLVIVGAGPAEATLRQHLPTALFLGERRGDELAAIYASLDVFVHSGPYETFGQTLQEAAASGLSVVAPAAGGPLDLVENEVTGLLVPPGDPDAFAAAVARLVADPQARAAFGAAGRRKVLGRSWPALTEELIGHYAAVLGRANGKAGEREPSRPAEAAQVRPREHGPATVARNLIPEQARRHVSAEPVRAAGDGVRRETAAGARTAETATGARTGARRETGQRKPRRESGQREHRASRVTVARAAWEGCLRYEDRPAGELRRSGFGRAPHLVA